ncbi:MAG: hypothetical protein JRJ49_00155 [Deltaproteobacteria bacterium]|nr:hypothetical protein [Deltaproteobacteria bacterium]
MIESAYMLNTELAVRIKRLQKPEYRIVFYLEDELITVTVIRTRGNIYKRAKRKKKL